MPSPRKPGKRGRPHKFGRQGVLVAVTLPEDVVQGLRKLHADLGWAIVTLFEKTHKTRAHEDTTRDDAELAVVGRRLALIVVNAHAFAKLPGVNVVPLYGDRAFLALEPGHGISDLELAVIDRLESPTLEKGERKVLASLRQRLREWRNDPSLRCDSRAIIVLERVGRPRRGTRRPRD